LSTVSPPHPPTQPDGTTLNHAVVKNYFATVSEVAPENVCSCSVMPCVRKQGEADRPWFETEVPGSAGVVRDVDHVITTAELGKIFQERGINLKVRGVVWGVCGGRGGEGGGVCC